MTADYAIANTVAGSRVSSMLDDIALLFDNRMQRSSPATISILPTDPPSWLPRLQDEVLISARATGFVTQDSWTHFEQFLVGLPYWVRKPEVSVGEGGEITLEWEGAGGEELHLTFSQLGDTAYWIDSSGEDEWSGRISDQRVVTAMISISS